MSNNKIKALCIIMVVVGVIGLFFNIKYCLIQEDGLRSALSAKLRAVVQYSPGRFLPRFEDGVKEALEKKKSPLGDSAEKQILSYLKFDGCWSAKVQNKGNLACTGVYIRLPYSEIFVVKREGFEPIISVSKTVVSIGKLSPLEEVMVYGWTSGHKEITFKNKSAIRLIYDGGVGRVVLKLPLAHYWYYFSKRWVLLLILWTIVLCAIMLYFFIKYRESDDSLDLDFKRRPKLPLM
jgi:hypothetical protein